MDTELALVRMQSVINTPFRVLAIFVFAVVVVIIVLNSS
jgi:hypothetical protein